MRALLLLAIFGLFSLNAWSAPTARRTTSIHNEVLSARALGMGGAITAAADDFNALSFNPAGLAYVKEWQIHGAIQMYLDDDVRTLVDDISNASDNNSGNDETEAIIDAFEKQIGKKPAGRLRPLYGAWVWPGMGFSFTPADATFEFEINQQFGPALAVSTNIDTTFVFGKAWDIKNSFGRLAVGAAAKAVHRGFYQDNLNAAQVAENDDFFKTEDVDEGFTVDADLGVMFTPNPFQHKLLKWMNFVKPTFGFVIRNVADYGFSTNFNLIDDNSGEPPKLERRFDIGAKFELPSFWIFHPRFVFDIRDMGHSNWNFKKGYHLGFELDWILWNWWKGAYRVGLNQGYLSAGIMLKLAAFQLDLVTYGEEVGVSGNARQSRRYLLEMSLDF